VVSIGIRAGQLGGTATWLSSTWYLTHEYLGRDQTCDLLELQVAPLTVPLFLKGRCLVTVVVRSATAAMPLLFAVTLALFFLSGNFFATDSAPAAWRAVANVFPVRHFLTAGWLSRRGYPLFHSHVRPQLWTR